MSVDTPARPTAASSPEGRRRKGLMPEGSAYIAVGIALVGVGLTLGPILYLILGGFRTQGDLAANPTGFPDPFMWQNYWEILSQPLFWRQLLNSTLVAVATTAGVVLFGTMAAYPLARYSFKGRELVFVIFTTGLMFPLTVAVLPLYLLLRDMGISGLWGLVIPQIAFGLPVTIIILRPFLAALPKELEEASFMDGISRIGFFWRMLLPLARPAMVTVGVLAFIGSWNAYLLPLLLLTGDPAGMTLPLGVTTFQGQHAAATTMIMAYTSLAMLPALAFFLLMERRIVDGLTGAVKG
ncbi:carbohydrate ABC transporter permease [Demequina sp. SYSU T00192]|uniref:Carbohydrate ABC transporter permease n=1 Tax=Demequina litoralis TaxID=3051660 RepID=A0ABT8G8F5_9MICO|nr:carbohydrate ABC transporter permease [Demequina sp. SYSU T00192]MDN4475347.1 carbohydrate ABC transporter permease [Demequina sp. SYSU T00192]